jgi:hypothetical protein
LIVASAVALLLAVLDHLKKLMLSASKMTAPRGAVRKCGDLRKRTPIDANGTNQ